MNVFTRLRRYTTTPGRDPVEDFTTEAFATVLMANPELGAAFVGRVSREAKWPEPVPPAARVSWSTQRRIEDVILDMVCEVEGGPVLVFEHKVWSPLYANQVATYRAAMERRHGAGRVRTVLITGRRGGWTQEADANFTWAMVHGLLSELAPTGHLVADFLAYLRSEGLGPAAPVSHQALLSYVPAQSVESTVAELVQHVQRETNWTTFEDLFAVVGEPQKPPQFEPLRWGRIGLSFASSWHPGFFVGVMLDGGDHLVDLVDPHKGPDFVALISFSLDDLEGHVGWTDYVLSAEFTRLRERLRRGAGGFHVFDVLDQPAKKQNRWHPLHLRVPLLDVLAGTRTTVEQVAAFQHTARRAADVVLGGGELAELRRRLLQAT